MNAISCEYVSVNEADTRRIAAALAPLCAARDCIRLIGDLGAGKTAFARGFIQALAGEGEEVLSPTFSLVQTYRTPGMSLWHFDLYRLRAEAELDELGLDEALAEGVSLIEWPDIAQSRLPAGALTVSIRQQNADSARVIRFSGDESAWGPRLQTLQKDLA